MAAAAAAAAAAAVVILSLLQCGGNSKLGLALYAKQVTVHHQSIESIWRVFALIVAMNRLKFANGPIFGK